jgi:ATP-dependent phosphofructokinase / diphosphate-dependent phosphofructokinase
LAEQQQKLAIVVGGGPAPGINGVISAATIRARLDGVEVIGVENGFSRIMQDDISHVVPLSIESVSRIHFEGGSVIGTARANPTKSPALLENVVTALLRLNVTRLITIGGDDTAFSAMSIEKQAAGRIRVAHVPKTIDNDLDLPAHLDTFGYQTARHRGVEIVHAMMVDAKTTGRWYFIVAMGRTAGHLALGIGKAAGATVSIIPEEFPRPIRLATIVDTLAGSIIKRLSVGREDGVAIIAEGLALDLDPNDLAELSEVERDAHGHIRLAELDLGGILKKKVAERLKSLGVSLTIASKNIGYELRCTAPIPFDQEYTRELGYSAAKFLADGGNAAMVSIQDGEFVPIPFSQMIDPKTGRTRVRRVDPASRRFQIARDYMIRLRKSDLDDPYALSKLADCVGLRADEFKQQFAAAVAHEQ